jgi:histone acetyltransferase 1
LYKAIHDWVIKSPQYAELTVEDPSEDFEDLRDKVDLRTLLTNQEFIHEAYGITGPGGKLSVGRVAKVKDGEKAVPEKKDVDSKTKSAGSKDIRVAAGSSKRGRPQKAMLGPPTQAKWAERWRKELKFAKVRLILIV